MAKFTINIGFRLEVEADTEIDALTRSSYKIPNDAKALYLSVQDPIMNPSVPTGATTL